MKINDIVMGKAEAWFKKYIFEWARASLVELSPKEETSWKIGYRDGYMEGMLQIEDFLNWIHGQGFFEKHTVTGSGPTEWRLYPGHSVDNPRIFTTPELFRRYVKHLEGNDHPDRLWPGQK